MADSQPIPFDGTLEDFSHLMGAVGNLGELSLSYYLSAEEKIFPLVIMVATTDSVWMEPPSTLTNKSH